MHAGLRVNHAFGNGKNIKLNKYKSALRAIRININSVVTKLNNPISKNKSVIT